MMMVVVGWSGGSSKMVDDRKTVSLGYLVGEVNSPLHIYECRIPKKYHIQCIMIDPLIFHQLLSDLPSVLF